MIRKTERLRSLVRAGKYDDAIRLAGSFRMLDKNVRRMLQIAKDVVNGNVGLYLQIGINVTDVYQRSKEWLNVKYG